MRFGEKLNLESVNEFLTAGSLKFTDLGLSEHLEVPGGCERLKVELPLLRWLVQVGDVYVAAVGRAGVLYLWRKTGLSCESESLDYQGLNSWPPITCQFSAKCSTNQKIHIVLTHTVLACVLCCCVCDWRGDLAAMAFSAFLRAVI